MLSLSATLARISGGGTLEIVFSDLIVETLAGNAQSPGHSRLVPAALGESVEQNQALALVDDFVEALAQRNPQDQMIGILLDTISQACLLYTSPSPRDS